MYRTALMAQYKRDNTDSYLLKSSCNDLISNFNKGEHIIDKDNEQNNYSIL